MFLYNGIGLLALSLEAWRQASTLSLFTKGVQGEVDTDAETWMKKSTRSTRGNSTKYIKPQSNTIAYTNRTEQHTINKYLWYIGLRHDAPQGWTVSLNTMLWLPV